MHVNFLKADAESGEEYKEKFKSIVFDHKLTAYEIYNSDEPCHLWHYLPNIMLVVRNVYSVDLQVAIFNILENDILSLNYVRLKKSRCVLETSSRHTLYTFATVIVILML